MDPNFSTWIRIYKIKQIILRVAADKDIKTSRQKKEILKKYLDLCNKKHVVLGCFQEKDRKALKEKVLWSLQVYKGKGEVGVQENMLPRSFHKIFADCRLPSWCMDIATKQKFLLPCQVCANLLKFTKKNIRILESPVNKNNLIISVKSEKTELV